MTDPTKIEALHRVRDLHPGVSSEVQCARIRSALSRFSITTFEAMRYLDVYHCPARILQLRKAGHRIVTHWQTVVTEGGEKHRVGLYMREGVQ